MPATTLYGIDLEVDLGIGRQAGAGVWDTSRWDDAVWAETDTSLGDWVDVSCQVKDGISLGAGASDADGVVTRWEAATFAFTLLGAEFDPWSGPWAGIIGPSVPVRLRWRTSPGLTSVVDELGLAPAVDSAGWSIAFIGYVDDGGYHYQPDPNPNLCLAQVQAVDHTTVLASFDGLEQIPAGSGETASARVIRVLDNARWPAADRDITAGGVLLKDTTLANTAWTELLAVADTDLALLWVNRAGQLAYRPTGRVGSGQQLTAVLVVCPDDAAGGIQVVDLERANPNPTRNIVSISRQVNTGQPEASTATISDQASVARYRARRYGRTDLLHLSDAWSTTVAQTILLSCAWPSDAPRRVELDCRLGDARVPGLLLALEPIHAFTLTDGTSTWRVGPVGWAIDIDRAHIGGQVALDDWTRWTGGVWDSALWDQNRWGV